MHTIHCPQCGGPMSILPQLAGRRVACPHCGHSLVAPSNSGDPVSPLPMASPVQPGDHPGSPTPVTMQYAPLPQQKTSGLAIASLVLGILSMCIGLLGILAIVLGVSARRAIAEDPKLKGKEMATWGLALGIIGAVLNYACMIVFWDEYRKMFGF